MSIIYTKHGFNPTINNVDKLERIFDLLEGQYRIETVDMFHHYFVYNKNAITDEIKELQKGLSKAFWLFRRYNGERKILKAFTEEEWKEFLKIEQQKKQESIQKLKSRVVIENNDEKEADNLAEYVYTQIKIKNKNCYVYGIKVDGELVYIGKTIRPLKERVKEHIECVLDKTIQNSQQNYLYEAMRLCKIGYKFEVLYESNGVISNHELEKIEKTLIENIKPKYNYEGVQVPYRFTEDKKGAINEDN